MNSTLKSDISLHLTSPLLSSVLQIYLLLPLPKSDSRDRRGGAPSLSFTAFPTRQAGAVTPSADASTAALTLTSHCDVCSLPDPEEPSSSPPVPGLPLNLPPPPFRASRTQTGSAARDERAALQVCSLGLPARNPCMWLARAQLPTPRRAAKGCGLL